MFGSDYPFWDPQRTLDTIEAAGLSDADVSAIRSENARRLFGLG
jgi:predicted TIM-barrel fold metal-dependent hydrolase